MSWTAPMTAVAGSVFTAAQFNQYVRDNLNMTAPALASGPGQWFISDGVNSVQPRTPTQALVATNQTTTATAYGDLATVGPTVTVTTGTQAIVVVFANISTTSTSALMSYAVSGATTIAANDSWALLCATPAIQASAVSLATGLTPGSNVFTAKYRVGAGTGTFLSRGLIVLPL